MLSHRTACNNTEPKVFTAVLIKPRVTGKLENEERRLETDSRVHRSELLKTGPQAQAELKLDDNTKLVLGPDAELVHNLRCLCRAGRRHGRPDAQGEGGGLQ